MNLYRKPRNVSSPSKDIEKIRNLSRPFSRHRKTLEAQLTCQDIEKPRLETSVHFPILCMKRPPHPLDSYQYILLDKSLEVDIQLMDETLGHIEDDGVNVGSTFLCVGLLHDGRVVQLQQATTITQRSEHRDHRQQQNDRNTHAHAHTHTWQSL